MFIFEHVFFSISRLSSPLLVLPYPKLPSRWAAVAYYCQALRPGRVACFVLALLCVLVCAHAMHSQPHSHTHQYLLKLPLVECVYYTSSKSSGSQRLSLWSNPEWGCRFSSFQKRHPSKRWLQGITFLLERWDQGWKEGICWSGAGTGHYLILCLCVELSTMFCSISLPPPSTRASLFSVK